MRNKAFKRRPTFSFTVIPYGGKLWRVQTLANRQEKHHWRNKLWRIDDESLNKRILKQFEDTSAPNLSICTHVFAHTCKLCQMAVVVFSSIYD